MESLDRPTSILTTDTFNDLKRSSGPKVLTRLSHELSRGDNSSEVRYLFIVIFGGMRDSSVYWSLIISF